MNLTALIVTYNRLEKLQLCWQATAPLGFQHIVIVDNASTDETTSWLASLNDERLSVVRTSQNLGGAGGFKTGSEFITQNLKTDWVFFYDDDAYPDENLLTHFQQLVPEHSTIYCSKVVSLDNKLCKMNLPYKKMPKTFQQTIDYACKPSNYLPGENEVSQVETFSFVGVVIPAQILSENLHLIRDELFIYFDDVYFSYALHHQNVSIIYEPSLLFKHDVIKNNNIYSTWKLYYLVRNVIFSRRMFKPEDAPFTLMSVVFRVCKIVGFTLFKGRSICSFKYLINGIMDGIQYKVGKRY